MTTSPPRRHTTRRQRSSSPVTIDVQHPFTAELLEVQSVIWVVVDDDALEAVPAQLTDATRGAPIKFDTRSDEVGPTPQDDDPTFLPRGYHLLCSGMGPSTKTKATTMTQFSTTAENNNNQPNNRDKR
jgi:hypothetical protein